MKKINLKQLKKGCGLILESPRPEDAKYEHIFGIGRAKPRNWKPYLPKRERQFWLPFCVSFSRLNCAEAKAKSIGIELNLSDRYLAVISGTTKKGNTLRKVSETFRKEGVVEEKECYLSFELLSRGWENWDKIFDLSEVDKNAKRYFGGNYSWLKPDLQILKDALSYSPIQIGVGIGNTWEDEVVTKPPFIVAYHAVCCYYIDDKYIYINDSIGREFKKLSLDYPIEVAMSFRDLPSNWKEIQESQKTVKIPLVRKKGTRPVFAVVNGKRFWITNEKALNDWKKVLGYHTLQEAWSAVKDVDTFAHPVGGIIGDLSFSQMIKLIFKGI